MSNAHQAHRMQILKNYARLDADRTGLEFTEDMSREELVRLMHVAGNSLFLPGDPNLDNQKRDISIEVFLTFSLNDLVSFGSSWLDKWRENSSAPWYREWSQIISRADYDELADILLSSDQNRVRQRISAPFAQMLGFDAVLKIKRRGRHEEV